MKITNQLLTAARAGTAKIEAGRHLIERGFYLTVTDTGAMSWTFKYSFKGMRREMGLGSFTGAGSVTRLSLAQAQVEADIARGVLARGEDPLAHRARANKSCTFAAVLERYIESNKASWNVTRKDGLSEREHRMRQQLNDYAKSLFNMPVTAITRDHVVALIKPTWSTKATATQTRDAIQKVMDFAEAEGLISTNPALYNRAMKSLLGEKRQSKNLGTMAIDDVPAFVAQLLEQDDTISRSFVFYILSGCRRNEIRLARWSEIDFDAKELTIPSERVKGQANNVNGKPHTVPLSTLQMAILAAQPRVAGNDHIWAGDVAGQPISQSCWFRRMRDMKIEGPTVHGFRSTFSDWAGEHPHWHLDVEAREFALAHGLEKVRGAYRRATAVDRRHGLMQDYCDRIEGKSNVVTLPVRRQA